ncbi:hypothetical protein BJY52DRAFT_1299883 [Lactarius psammicola]|nr:hypothetical protein BJY52DRAFT_1299883 [Lactarius psammicola]
MPVSTPALQRDADFRTSSDAPDAPSSSSPTATHDAMISMGALSSSEPPATRSDDRARARSDSHSLMSATASPAPSPPQEPAPHSDATAEGEGSAVAALRTDMETLGRPLVDPAGTGAAVHDPLQLPSLTPVIDTAVAGPSKRILDAEHAQADPPHPSHGQYDMV